MRLGPYEVVGELGRGAMGAVYRAHDTAADREVALKLITGPLTEQRRERFRREGELTAKLDHPGIVRVHSAGLDEAGRPWIAYELVEGARPLGPVLPGLDLTDRVRLVVEAAEALGHAHAHGVVHRDVKPDNLLVDGSGHVRVADFGVATAQDVERLTRTGAWVGTPTHMAPEQLRDPGSVGPAADVWALGVVLHEALTGELPFGETTAGELVTAIQRGAPKITNPEVPRSLRAVCARALSQDPSARFADGASLAAALQEALARPQRGLPPRLGAAGGVVIALAALALGAAASLYEGAPGAAPASPQTPSPPRRAAGPAPSRPRPLSGAQLEEANQALRVLRAQEDPARVLKDAAAWLRAYPGHTSAAEVEALLSGARVAEPLASAKLEQIGEEGTAQLVVARFLDAERIAAILTGDEALRIWRWRDERLVAEPRRDCGGQLVCLEATGEGELFVLRVQGPEHLLRIGVDGAPRVVTFAGESPRGGAAREARDWRLAVMANSREETTLALAMPPREVWVLRIDGSGVAHTVLRMSPPQGELARALALSPDGRHLLVGSAAKADGDEPGSARLYHLPEGSLVQTVSFRSNTSHAALSDDRAAVSTVWGEVYCGPLSGPWELLCDPGFELEHPNLLARSHLGACRELTFSSDHRALLTISAQPQTDVFNAGPGEGNELRAWSLGEEPALVYRTEAPAEPHSLHVDPSGRYAVIGSRERGLLVYATR